MRLPVQNGQLAKVLVERHEDAVGRGGDCEDFPVAGIGSPVSAPVDFVARLKQLTLGARPTRRCRVGPSPTRNRGGRGLDWFVTDQPTGVREAGVDVVTFEPGVALQQGLERVACRQHAEDMLYRQPSIPDDGLATENIGVRG